MRVAPKLAIESVAGDGSAPLSDGLLDLDDAALDLIQPARNVTGDALKTLALDHFELGEHGLETRDRLAYQLDRVATVIGDLPGFVVMKIVVLIVGVVVV